MERKSVSDTEARRPKVADTCGDEVVRCRVDQSKGDGAPRYAGALVRCPPEEADAGLHTHFEGFSQVTVGVQWW